MEMFEITAPNYAVVAFPDLASKPYETWGAAVSNAETMQNKEVGGILYDAGLGADEAALIDNAVADGFNRFING